jgi:DNA modification methylase
MSKIKWHTEQRVIDDLIPYDKNPRILTEKQAKDLEKSIQEFDLAEIPAINTDNKIVAGHMRLKIMQELGRGKEVIDVRVPNRELTEKEFKKYLLRSNKNTGEWDMDGLANNFDIDLLKEVGFSDDDFGNIFGSEPGTQDDIPDVEEDSQNISILGDIWQLGKHRILCGDSRVVTDVSVLLENKKVNMVLTDPPYGINYSSKNEFLNKWDKGNSNQKEIENDSIEDYRTFFSEFLSIIPVAEYNTFYIFMFGQKLHELRLAFDDCDIKWGDYLIWVKNNHVLGLKDYQPKHEFCVYGWKEKHKFYGDFTTTLLEFDKPLKNDLHPTMKPIELLCKLINDGSRREDIVYDAFLGSGSTLIACEQTNRVCYGIEIDPKYIDVICQRYYNFSGIDPIRQSDGAKWSELANDK